jgi:hypothetical protein
MSERKNKTLMVGAYPKGKNQHWLVLDFFSISIGLVNILKIHFFIYT